MNIETLNTKVDQVVSTMTNTQEKFTQKINNMNEELLELKKRIETLENNTVIFYLMSDFFDESDVNRYYGFKFNDPFFKIKLPVKPLVISKKDLSFKPFNNKINDNR